MMMILVRWKVLMFTKSVLNVLMSHMEHVIMLRCSFGCFCPSWLLNVCLQSSREIGQNILFLHRVGCKKNPQMNNNPKTKYKMCLTWCVTGPEFLCGLMSMTLAQQPNDPGLNLCGARLKKMDDFKLFYSLILWWVILFELLLLSEMEDKLGGSRHELHT